MGGGVECANWADGPAIHCLSSSGTRPTSAWAVKEDGMEADPVSTKASTLASLVPTLRADTQKGPVEP